MPTKPLDGPRRTIAHGAGNERKAAPSWNNHVSPELVAVPALVPVAELLALCGGQR